MALLFLPAPPLDAPRVTCPGTPEPALLEPMPALLETVSAPVADVLPVNRTLPAPWDFNAVLVLAPFDGAGLGDFSKQAQQLDDAGICHFTFAYSRFDGAGAAREMQDALGLALAHAASTKAAPPDAVVVLGATGPTDDRAWLDDAELAAYLGALPMPVWTVMKADPGPGRPLLDAVVHTRFETPAALMTQLQRVISQRLVQAKANFEQITTLAANALHAAKARARALELGVRVQAQRQLAQRQQSADDLIHTIRHAARQAPQPESGLRFAGPPL